MTQPFHGSFHGAGHTSTAQKPTALKSKLSGDATSSDDASIIGFDEDVKPSVTSRVYQSRGPVLRNWKISTEPLDTNPQQNNNIFEDQSEPAQKTPAISTKASIWQSVFQYLGIFLTVSWFTYAGLHIWSMPGGISQILTSPMALGSVIATVLTPVALFWVCFSSWQRRSDAHLYAETLRLELQRLLFPSKDQARAVNSDIQILVQQAVEISATSRGAIKAIQRARQGLRAEIRDFAGVSQKTEFHIDRLAETLHKRAEYLLNLTDKIETRTHKINEEVTSGITMWSETSDKAFTQINDLETRFAQSGSKFESQAQVLRDATALVSTETLTLENVLEERIEKLEEISQRGIEVVEAASDGFENLSKNAENLFTKALQTEEALTKQAGVIRDTADHLSTRVVEIEEVGQSAANKLSESLALALSGSDSIVAAVRRAREQLEKAASDATGKANSIIDETGGKLRSFVSLTVEQIEKTTADVSGKTNSIIDSTNDKLREFVASTAEQVEKASTLLVDFDRSEKTMGELIDKLSIQSDGVAQASGKAVHNLTEAAYILDKSAESVKDCATQPAENLRKAAALLDRQMADIQQSLQLRIDDIGEVTNKASATAGNITATLQSGTENIAQLADKIAGQTSCINKELDNQHGKFSNYISETHGKFDDLQSKLRNHSDEFSGMVSHAQSRLVELEQDLSGKSRMAIEQIESRTSDLSRLESNIADRLSSLSGNAEQVHDRLQELTSGIRASSEQSAEWFEKTSARAENFSSDLAKIQENYTQSGRGILDRMHELETGLQDRFGKLEDRADAAGRNLQNLANNVAEATGHMGEATLLAAGKLQHVKDNLQNGSEDLQTMIDQARIRADNLREAMDKNAEGIASAISQAANQLEDATHLFNRSTESIEENAMTGALAIESAAQKILDEGQRVSSLGEQALHKTMRVITIVQDESQQLVDKSRETLTEMQRVSDGFQMRSREVEEYSKAALNNTRNYTHELKNQVEQISQSSASATDAISDALAKLSVVADEADQNGNKVIQRLKFARETLGIEAENFDTVISKSTQLVEDTTGKFKRQSEAVAKAVQDIGTHAERIRDIQLRNSREAFLTSTKFVVESLHSLAVDVSRHLENDVDEKSWKSYQKGDVAVFTRRLVHIAGQLPMETAKRKYAEDGEFRNYSQRFIRQFEELFESAQKSDYGDLLKAVFTSSDIGKLYMILCEVTGHSVKTH